MITGLKLNNWRSHADTELEFKKGTNLLIGIMGSGKSSVMDAVCFSLFGTFPSLESRRVKIKDLFRNDSDNIQIEIKLKLNGNEYKIERKINKKGEKHNADAFVYRDGKLIEKGNSAVSKYIEQVLQIDYGLFTRAIYSEQNSIDYFLSLNPKKRKEEFDSLLGLDKFEKARANATTLANRIKNKREDFEVVFDLEKLEKEKKNLEENKEKAGKIENEEKEIKEKKEKEEPELKKLEEKLKELKKKEREFEEIEEKEIKLKNTIEIYDEKIKGKKANKEEVKDKQKLMEKVKKEIKEIELEVEKNEKEFLLKNKESGIIENLFRRKEEIEENIKEIKIGNLKNEKEKLEKLEKIMIENEVEAKGIKQDVEEIEKLLENAKKGKEKCPFCGIGISKEKIEEHVKEKEMEMRKNREKINELKEKMNEYKKEFGKLEREIREGEGKLKRKEILETEVKKIKIEKKDIEHLKTEIKELEEEIKERKIKKKEFEKKREELNNEIRGIEEIIEINEKMERYKEMLPILIKKKKENGFDKKEMEKLEKETGELKINIEKIKGRIFSLENEIKYLKEMNRNYEKNIEEMEKRKRIIEKLGKKEEEILIYRNVLKEVQVKLRDELIESINNAMDEMWRIFYPYGDYEKLRVNITENDYSLEVYNGEWKVLESVVSGGERACAALTLRVALSTVLTPNLSWLILDEPTHNLDREAIRLLSDTLQEKVPEIIEQIFVITHEELLLGANFASSYRLKRDKSKGEATQLELL